MLKAPDPAAKLFVPVAEELKFVVAPIEMFEETFPLPLLKNTPLIVPFEPDVEIEPVTPKDPVIKALPVYGNVSAAFNAKEAVKAFEAVPKSEPVKDVDVKEPVTFSDPDKERSYAAIPVNASIDWVTWYASTVFPVVIPVLFKILAIYIFVINM